MEPGEGSLEESGVYASGIACAKTWSRDGTWLAEWSFSIKEVTCQEKGLAMLAGARPCVLVGMGFIRGQLLVPFWRSLSIACPRQGDRLRLAVPLTVFTCLEPRSRVSVSDPG